jgi:hypothetical protein
MRERQTLERLKIVITACTEAKLLVREKVLTQVVSKVVNRYLAN